MTLEARLLELLESHGPALRRVARVYGRPDGEEEDLHQEILLQLWKALPSFRGDAAPGTWLYRIALNTALTWRRGAARRARHGAHPPAAPSATAGEARNQAAILEEFLASLGELDRSVLLLYMEGLSHDEIADVTGLSAGAAGVRIHRIKQAYLDRFVRD